MGDRAAKYSKKSGAISRSSSRIITRFGREEEGEEVEGVEGEEDRGEGDWCSGGLNACDVS